MPRSEQTKRSKLLSEMRYKKPGIPFDDEFMPTLPGLDQRLEIFEAHMTAEGTIERGGEQVEFIDVRFWAKPKKG